MKCPERANQSFAAQLNGFRRPLLTPDHLSQDLLDPMSSGTALRAFIRLSTASRSIGVMSAKTQNKVIIQYLRSCF
jgi:hypothetical protein